MASAVVARIRERPTDALVVVGVVQLPGQKTNLPWRSTAMGITMEEHDKRSGLPPPVNLFCLNRKDFALHRAQVVTPQMWE